jgi:hypothetical protein
MRKYALHDHWSAGLALRRLHRMQSRIFAHCGSARVKRRFPVPRTSQSPRQNVTANDSQRLAKDADGLASPFEKLDAD